MTHLKLAVAVLAAICATSLAPSRPAAQIFRPQIVWLLEHYCVANLSNGEAVRRDAEREGFRVVPASSVPAMAQGGRLGDRLVFARREGGRSGSLIMTATEQVGAQVNDICSVGLEPPRRAQDVVAAVARWVGLPPSRRGRDAVIWGYIEDGEGRRTALEQLGAEARGRALAEGRVRVVSVNIRAGANLGGVMFTVPRRR